MAAVLAYAPYRPRVAPHTATRTEHELVRLGAGFSDIDTAVELDRAGFPDFDRVDRDEGVGGVGRVGTCRRVAVDIRSLSDSFSDARNPVDLGGYRHSKAPKGEARP